MRSTGWVDWCALGVAALCAVLLLSLAGCGTKRHETRHSEHQEQKTAKTTTVVERSGVDASGAGYHEQTKTTAFTEEVAKGEAAAQIESTTTIQAPELAAAVSAVGAAASGTPLGQMVGTVSTLIGVAVAGYAAVQKAKASAQEKRAEEHKADAEEGWAMATNQPTKKPRKPTNV